MIMYVSLFGHSAVVFHVSLCFTDICVVVYFSVTFYRSIDASLFNRLIHLLTYSSTLSQRTNWGSGRAPGGRSNEDAPEFLLGAQNKMLCDGVTNA